MNTQRARHALLSLIITIFISWLKLPLAVCQGKNDPEWSFLSTTAIGAREFIQTHPQWDGRGVVIFILDSGVDMSVAGLTKTSTGQVKVIDARDFSGQGDVVLSAGEIKSEGREQFIEHADGFRLYNYHLLEYQPSDSEYFIGYLDEQRFKNSDVPDINSNGRQDDRFGILAFPVAREDSSYWIAYVDTDADGHVEDEQPLRDYRLNYDTFQFRGGDPKFDRRPMTFVLNIHPYDKVSLHFDDSGHGTHVAGIAAGFQLHGQADFHGIAPGAQIISLKIGSGNYEGSCTVSGSMRKALNFVEDFARRTRQPVVINLSYGIGSIREGHSDIDHIVSSVLSNNQNVFIAVSNGNDGPGISTTGSPAAANLAFSVGAMLPVDIARDCYGARIERDKIFYFSSRGGELNKPDALAPGAAAATVPKFTDQSLLKGTSMAAPQVAGAAALLWSACLQNVPAQIINNLLLHRALKYTARPMPGATFLDQGNGVINVPLAFQFLKDYSAHSRDIPIFDYQITTECPGQPDGVAAAAYWRTGSYYPADREAQIFTIRPIFPDSLPADDRANFYRAYDLQASHPWLSARQGSIYIQGERAATVTVDYRPELLTQPGLYVGKIIAYRKIPGKPRYQPFAREFELLATIIIPHQFDHGNQYQQNFMNRRLSPGDVERYFVLVPPGATTCQISLAPSKTNFCDVTCFIFTPAGIKYASTPKISSKQQNQEMQIIPAEALGPGIWEIDVYADFQNSRPSYYDLTIRFGSFKIEPLPLSNFRYQSGQSPTAKLTVTNQFGTAFYGFGRGKVQGFQRQLHREVRDSDTFTYDFTVETSVERVEFDIDVDDESFLKFTDLAVNVYDASGVAVYQDAFNTDQFKVVLDQIAPGQYTLELAAAFAYSSYNSHWGFTIIEKFYTRDNINIKIYHEADRVFKLYPFVTNRLELTLSSSPRIPPDGFYVFGIIEFIDRDRLQRIFTVPIELVR